MPYIIYRHTQNKRIQKAKQEHLPNTYLYLHHHASKCTDSKNEISHGFGKGKVCPITGYEGCEGDVVV